MTTSKKKSTSTSSSEPKKQTLAQLQKEIEDKEKRIEALSKKLDKEIEIKNESISKLENKLHEKEAELQHRIETIIEENSRLKLEYDGVNAKLEKAKKPQSKAFRT